MPEAVSRPRCRSTAVLALSAVAYPGGKSVAGGGRHRNLANLVALAVQADGAGAGGDGEVLDVEPGALLRAGPGVEQYGDDGGVTDAAAVCGSLDRTLSLV